ncbi:MAG: leucyl aminopeptidase [Acetobacteraceae bacterium SCN 69-10]|nr:MAG: leucyl aminopeptidase [Acetobacteraceae bacterium SCN 69-10]
MLHLFQEELRLCKVSPGETVAVLTAGTVRADYAQAFLLAARHLGANSFQVNIPNDLGMLSAASIGKTPLANCRPAINALKEADMVIDLLGLLFSQEQLEITNSGTRMLYVAEPFHVLKQMFPTESLRKRVENAAERFKTARLLHVTSKAGTDIRYQLGQYPVMTEYGYTDTPGRWDHFPSGFLFTHGNDDGVDGTVVLMPGDAIAAFRRYLTSRVVLTVEKGHVTKIEGDGMDADLISDYLSSFDDPRAYAVSHIGWGLNERAKWFHMVETRELNRERAMNSLSFYGNVLFSTGPNTELGGTNDTACHLDLPLRNCSLTLDGELIVERGTIVPADMRK